MLWGWRVSEKDLREPVAVEVKYRNRFREVLRFRGKVGLRKLVFPNDPSLSVDGGQSSCAKPEANDRSWFQINVSRGPKPGNNAQHRNNCKDRSESCQADSLDSVSVISPSGNAGTRRPHGRRSLELPRIDLIGEGPDATLGTGYTVDRHPKMPLVIDGGFFRHTKVPGDFFPAAQLATIVVHFGHRGVTFVDPYRFLPLPFHCVHLNLGRSPLAIATELSGLVQELALPGRVNRPEVSQSSAVESSNRVVLRGPMKGWQVSIILSVAFLGVLTQASAQDWIQLNPPTSPPASSFGGMGYHAATQRSVLFVGYGENGASGTWLWDGSIWTPATSLNQPSPRNLYTPPVYDSARNQLVLYGGADPYVGQMTDTWVWNGSQWLNKNAAPPENTPVHRSSFAMAYDARNDKTILYGGLGFDNGAFSLTDTWLWDGTQWSQASPLNNPGARYAHSMTFDAARNEIVLYGGFQGGAPMNDTWVWNGSNWTQKHPVTSPPVEGDTTAPDPLVY